MIEAQPKASADVGLHLVLDAAELTDLEPGLLGGQLSRRAVLVGGTDEQDLLALEAEVPGIDVGRQLRSNQVAEVLHPVDIGKRAGDQVPGHGLRRLPVRPT